MKKLIIFLMTVTTIVSAQSVPETISLFKQSTRTTQFFENSYAYAVIPKVTKAGLLIGHAGGKGTLFVQGEESSKVKISFQLVGPVLGMEQYSQIVFFKDKESLDTFMKSDKRFSKSDKAQPPLSKESNESTYINGVAVFTNKSKGLGVFYSPSLRGQKLKKIS